MTELRRDRRRHRSGRPLRDLPSRGRRHEGRGRRAEPHRRNLRQHRLHSDEDNGGERLRGAHGRPRRRVRRRRRPVPRRHEACEGAEGRDLRAIAHRSRRLAAEHGELHRLPGPRPVRIRTRRARRRRTPAGRQDLPERRRSGVRAGHAGHSRDRRPHQQLDDVGGFPAEAPDRRRRQLHRSRIRADVSALRRRGHDPRNGRRGSSPARTKTCRPRSGRSSRARASRCA